MTARPRTRAATHKRANALRSMAGKLANGLRSMASALRSLADDLDPRPVQDTEVSCMLSLLVSLRGSELGLPVHYQLGLGLSAKLEEETRRDLVVPIRGVAGVDTLGIRVGWTPENVQHRPAGTQHRTI